MCTLEAWRLCRLTTQGCIQSQLGLISPVSKQSQRVVIPFQVAEHIQTQSEAD